MLLPRNLERVWDSMTPEERLLAETEARVILSNLVCYTSRGHYPNDVTLLAASLVQFRRQLVSAEASNIVTEEQVEAAANHAMKISQQYAEGAIMANELVGAIIVRFHENGVL